MQQENAIEVRDVYKSFKVYFDKGNSFKERILFKNRNKFEVRNVLNGVSFSVKKGEAIGLIGKNGCGKSTTLKMLTRILRPNSGTIEMKGRVSSLIELGAGFHQDMTGRENIYINASIFGIKRKEVDERIDKIIRFSELEDYIDNPVRTYSSGMYMRLAFSVAINVDADILLIDEILAVGDSAFQEKCFNKLKSLKDEGTTIVIVSHAMGQIEKICDRCIWIENGEIRDEGPTKKVCKEYNLAMDEARNIRAKKEAADILAEQKKLEEEEARKKLEQEKLNATCFSVTEQCGADAHRETTGQCTITSVQLMNANGDLETNFFVGDDMIVQIEYTSKIPGEPINFGIGFSRSDWTYCCSADVERMSGQNVIAQSKGKATLRIKNCQLLPGKYYLDVGIYSPKFEIKYDYLYSLINVEMTSKRWLGSGVFRLDYDWTIDGVEYQTLPDILESEI